MKPIRSGGRRTHVGIGGHGAELYKGTYGWQRLSEMSEQVPKTVRDAFLTQAMRGLDEMGIPTDDPWGSEWHYLGYRNSFHSGRTTMSTMTTFRPIMQRKLVALSRSERNELPAPEKGEKSIVSDILIALSPELASLPFDDPKKSMSAEYIAGRKSALPDWCSNGRPDPYAIFGTPLSVKAGASDLALSLAGKRGLAGPKRADKIVELAERGYDCLPRRLKIEYEPFLKMVREELSDGLHANAPPCKAASKLMSGLLCDGSA